MSLIYGPIVAILIQTIIYWIIAPIIPKISQFDYQIFKTLLKFGFPILLSSIVIYFNTHLDDIIIAQVVGLTFLGFYTLAYNISNYVATLISNPVASAMYPVYCNIQDDKDELKATFEYHYRMIFTPVIFITFFILFNAQFLISFLFGDKWLNSIIILQILVFEGLFRALGSVASNIFLVVNKYYIVLILSSIYLGLMIPLSIFATISYGIIGTATVVTVISFPLIYLHYWFLKKYVKFSIFKDTIIRIFGCVLAVPPMLIILTVFASNPLLVLALNLIIALLIYMLTVNFLTKGVLFGEIKDTINVFLKRKKE